MTPGFTIPDGIGPYATIVVVVITALVGMIKSSRDRKWEREDRAEERRQELEDATNRQNELRLQIEAHAHKLEQGVELVKVSADRAFDEANHAKVKLEGMTENLVAQAEESALTNKQILVLTQQFAALLKRDADSRVALASVLEKENAAQRIERADVAKLVAGVATTMAGATTIARQEREDATVERAALRAIGDDTNARMQQIVPDAATTIETPKPTVGEQISETHERVTKTLKLEEERKNSP